MAQGDVAIFLATVAAPAISGDWLIQSTRLGLKLSFTWDPDGTWEHRILDISDVEATVAPGGGLAAVANMSFTVAEDGAGQSILQLWRRFSTIGGKADIRLDFLLDSGITFRVFTGIIDTINVRNGRSQVLCVDESIQRNLQLPQRLVTSSIYPFAASGALTQPLGLIYGRGSHLGVAPLLFTNTVSLGYTAADHSLSLSPTIGVYNPNAQVFLPGTVTAVAAPGAAGLFLQSPMQQQVMNTISGPFAVFTQLNVTFPTAAIDGNSTTVARVYTNTLASNFDGQGYLGIVAVPTSAQRGNNQAAITLANHRRGVGSDPTVTGEFIIQTVDMVTGSTLRSAIFTTQQFRQTLNPITTPQTVVNLPLGDHEAVEVLLYARNEGGVGTASNFYEIGEIGIQTGYQPPGDTFPIFLYQNFDGRRDDTGYVTTTAGTLYIRPSEIIGSLLFDELGLALSSTFQGAYLFYLAGAWAFDGGVGYGWSVPRANVRDILNAAAQQGIAILAPDLLGAWGVRPFDPATPIHFAFGLGNILTVAGATDAAADDATTIALGNMANVHCRYEIHYGWNVGSQKFDRLLYAYETGTNALSQDELRLLCQLSSFRYGTTESLIINAYWITDTHTAQLLLAHIVQYFTFQRIFVTFDTTFQAISLQLGDFISIAHPLLPAADDGGTFEVHTLRTSPTSGRITTTASKIAAVYLEYFIIRDQTNTYWYFWFDTDGGLVRDSTLPNIPPFSDFDVTGTTVPPWWHHLISPTGAFWFLYPAVQTGELIVDSAPPALGSGRFYGFGITVIGLNTREYRLGASPDPEQGITIEDITT